MHERRIPLLPLCASLAGATVALGQTLHERGPVASIPGGHASGADLFQAAPEGAPIGVNANHDFSTYLAQPFEATAPWTVQHVTVWLYQNGSSLAPSLTGLALEVWDGAPGEPTSARVAGDIAQNVLGEATFSGVYATFFELPHRTDRPIMAVRSAPLGWELEPGRYWLIWGATGSLAGGPFATPLATRSGPIPGDALQGRFGVWAPARAGSEIQLAFPLLIEGDGACQADCDQSGALDLFDFLCFMNLHAAGDPGADCDASGAIGLEDFLCFQAAFAAGCP